MFKATWTDGDGVTRCEQDIASKELLAEHRQWVQDELGGTQYRVQPIRAIAIDRDESEPCEALTPGCCIDHRRDQHEGCDTW